MSVEMPQMVLRRLSGKTAAASTSSFEGLIFGPLPDVFIVQVSFFQSLVFLFQLGTEETSLYLCSEDFETGH